MFFLQIFHLLTDYLRIQLSDHSKTLQILFLLKTVTMAQNIIPPADLHILIFSYLVVPWSCPVIERHEEGTRVLGKKISLAPPSSPLPSPPPSPPSTPWWTPCWCWCSTSGRCSHSHFSSVGSSTSHSGLDLAILGRIEGPGTIAPGRRT